jgi:hypothetical protein
MSSYYVYFCSVLGFLLSVVSVASGGYTLVTSCHLCRSCVLKLIHMLVRYGDKTFEILLDCLPACSARSLECSGWCWPRVRGTGHWQPLGWWLLALVENERAMGISLQLEA